MIFNKDHELDQYKMIVKFSHGVYEYIIDRKGNVTMILVDKDPEWIMMNTEMRDDQTS